MEIRRATGSTPFLTLAMRGTYKFISVLNRMSMKLHSKLGSFPRIKTKVGRCVPLRPIEIHRLLDIPSWFAHLLCPRCLYQLDLPPPGLAPKHSAPLHPCSAQSKG